MVKIVVQKNSKTKTKKKLPKKLFFLKTRIQ